MTVKAFYSIVKRCISVRFKKRMVLVKISMLLSYVSYVTFRALLKSINDAVHTGNKHETPG